MPYTEHPYEVAKILADLKQDQPTVIAGLLHDVVEDTPHTLAEIATEFGEDTAFMVDAVTKITAAQEENKTAQKAETYRKLINAMAKDPRVVITGGEPLMRPDLEECGKEIQKRGYPWGMVSNGLAMTPERYTRLLNAGLKSLTISLDGLESNHNHFRGSPLTAFQEKCNVYRMVALTRPKWA